LFQKKLVNGLPKLKFEKDRTYEACQKGKHAKNSFKWKTFISTIRPLELIHMDLFGSSRIMSIGGKWTFYSRQLLYIYMDTIHSN